MRLTWTWDCSRCPTRAFYVHDPSGWEIFLTCFVLPSSAVNLLIYLMSHAA